MTTKKPALVVLAAGMGSRYGGLKQIDPVGANGEVIIDYSVFDARRAGFDQIIFIINHAMENDFNEVAGHRIRRRVNLDYCYQELDDLPAGYTKPAERVKPWGTSHAILSIRDTVKGPFCVVNADDYYGPTAFRTMYDWLTKPKTDNQKMHACMVGYRLGKTIPYQGHVARGVCAVNEANFLTDIQERTYLERTPDGGGRYSEDQGNTWNYLPANTLVSMNFWGFDVDFLSVCERDFPSFLDENLPKDPLKCEYLLPREVDRLLHRGEMDVEVLASEDEWLGLTYRQDKAGVVSAMAEKHANGHYPTPLW